MNILVIVKRNDTTQNKDKTISIDFHDRMAVELAVAIKEKSFIYPVSVSVICIAPADSSNVIRDCFALGADNAYLLDDKSFETVDIDGLIRLLSKGIKKASNPDIVVMASNSNDDVLISLGKKLAETLNYKHLLVDDFDGQDKRLFAKVRNKQDKIPLDSNVMLNLTLDIEQPFPNAKRIMKLFKKEVTIFNARDLDFN